MAKGKESKPHIGIYGRRNNGKSSLINCLAGQDIAIVSEVAGTTTDPVKKSFEITGFGPVILLDTAGFDDEGELGRKRVAKTFDSLQTVDLALLLVAHNQVGTPEKEFLLRLKEWEVPFLVIYSKSDMVPPSPECLRELSEWAGMAPLVFSSHRPGNLDELIGRIRQAIPESAYTQPALMGDLLSYGDIVLLITPIDVQAPEGRLILPQVQAIRDILDNDAVAIVLKEREVDAFLRKTGIRPALAVTDSQIFVKADASVPREIPLTSFSILLARFKGDFPNYLQGTPKISQLQDGDRVLILESCTHHVSCDDIGRVKIPRWLSSFTGKKLQYEVVSGLNATPRPMGEYSLVIQCGGCVLTRRQIVNRLRPAIQAGVPVTNYGMAIAWVQGIYERAVAPFVQEGISPHSYL